MQKTKYQKKILTKDDDDDVDDAQKEKSQSDSFQQQQHQSEAKPKIQLIEVDEEIFKKIQYYTKKYKILEDYEVFKLFEKYKYDFKKIENKLQNLFGVEQKYQELKDFNWSITVDKKENLQKRIAQIQNKKLEKKQRAEGTINKGENSYKQERYKSNDHNYRQLKDYDKNNNYQKYNRRDYNDKYQPRNYYHWNQRQTRFQQNRYQQQERVNYYKKPQVLQRPKAQYQLKLTSQSLNLMNSRKESLNESASQDPELPRYKKRVQYQQNQTRSPVKYIRKQEASGKQFYQEQSKYSQRVSYQLRKKMEVKGDQGQQDQIIKGKPENLVYFGNESQGGASEKEDLEATKINSFQNIEDSINKQLIEEDEDDTRYVAKQDDASLQFKQNTQQSLRSKVKKQQENQQDKQQICSKQQKSDSYDQYKPQAPPSSQNYNGQQQQQQINPQEQQEQQDYNQYKRQTDQSASQQQAQKQLGHNENINQPVMKADYFGYPPPPYPYPPYYGHPANYMMQYYPNMPQQFYSQQQFQQQSQSQQSQDKKKLEPDQLNSHQYPHHPPFTYFPSSYYMPPMQEMKENNKTNKRDPKQQVSQYQKMMMNPPQQYNQDSMYQPPPQFNPHAYYDYIQYQKSMEKQHSKPVTADQMGMMTNQQQDPKKMQQMPNYYMYMMGHQNWPYQQCPNMHQNMMPPYGGPPGYLQQKSQNEIHDEAKK